MKQLVVISGKGGTGKTSITAAFASLASSIVLTDCDVDAANLHLLFPPEQQESEAFVAGQIAQIAPDKCTGCGQCAGVCRFGAISERTIHSLRCEGCGVCVLVCPTAAITFTPEETGKIHTAQTRVGPFVHARLGIGAENSGKLVAQVRERAANLAATAKRELVLIDGAPGIGCAVIASLTGVDLALVVTEPTPSGISDLKRILQLIAHFGITPLVCLNKVGISEKNEGKVRDFCARHGLDIVGEVPFDPAITQAMLQGKSVVEASDGPAAQAIRKAWAKVEGYLEGSNN